MSAALQRQAEAVRQAGERANEAITNAEIMGWSEGDWRMQQLKKRLADLTAAYETLKALPHGQSQPDQTNKDR